MNRRHRTRTRQKQINILHTTTKKRNSNKQITQIVVWSSLVLAMIAVVGIGLHCWGQPAAETGSLYQSAL